MLWATLVCALVALASRPPRVGAFKLCPHRCSCHDSSRLVDCKARALTLVPGHVPYGTWLLDLSANNLTEIPTGAFGGLRSLRVVLLSGNRLGVLRPGAFESLGFAERLDLSDNELRRLPVDFSECLRRLTELSLSGNRLAFLRYSSLRRLERLEKLDLSANRIASMESGAFRGLTRLQDLLLGDNRLTVIEGGFFFMLQKLEALGLESNGISSVHADAFSSLRSLTRLALNGNRLSHLAFGVFLSLRTPGTHLQLADNRWACDCDLQRVFAKVASVRHLRVDDYANMTCAEPLPLAGLPLAAVDTQLCVAETATVLVITATVLVTILAAVVMAERNRKKNGNRAWGDSESPIDSQEK